LADDGLLAALAQEANEGDGGHARISESFLINASASAFSSLLNCGEFWRERGWAMRYKSEK